MKVLLLLAFCFLHNIEKIGSVQVVDNVHRYLPEDVRLNTPSFNLPDYKICHDLWKQTGTYCDLRSTIEYSKTSQSEVNDGIAELATLLDQLYSGFSVIAEHKNLNLLLYPQEVKAVKKVANSNLLRKSREQGRKCWDYMMKARNATLCFTCSGDYKRYFYRERALIRQKDCKVMVKHCKAHIRHTLKLLKAGVTVNKVKALLTKIDPQNRGGYHLTMALWADSQKRKKVKDEVYGHYSYLERVIKHIIKESQVTNLNCEWFFTLYKKPFIFKLLALVKLAKQWDDMFWNSYSKYLPKSNWRNLQLGPGTSLKLDVDFFAGDVTILKQDDNMFSSYDGNQGTTLGVLSLEYKPMNLTWSFP